MKEDLKDNRDRIKQYKKKKTFQKKGRKFYQHVGGGCSRTINNRMQRKQKKNGVKYGNRKNIIERPTG